MNTPSDAVTRFRPLLDFCTIVALGYALKVVLDQVLWRYSGPISLAAMLVVIFLYLRMRKESWSWIGLVSIKSRKGWVLFAPQILIAFIAIIAAGGIVTVIGDASGLEFMKPNRAGAADRFGDLAGNTQHFVFWVAILWFAGPAEELYFRGFMMGKLREVLGESGVATALTVLIPALIFGAGHVYYLGLRGFVTTSAIGITLGVLFLLYKRNIWPLMIAHASVNTLSFTALYLDLDV